MWFNRTSLRKILPNVGSYVGLMRLVVHPWRQSGSGVSGQSRAGLAVHGWGCGGLVRPAGAASSHEAPPRLQSFSGPDPDSRRDAHHQAHEVLEHENSVVRTSDGALSLQWAGAGQGSLPAGPVVLLVDQAGHHHCGGDGVQHREEADPDHQPLQLVRLCTSLFDDAPDAEQRNETSEEKKWAGEEVNH